MKSRRSLVLLAAAVLGIGRVAGADSITDWNQIGTQAAANAGGANGTGANGYTRTLAISNLAVYDAVNSITGTHNPYVAAVPFSGPASTDAAVIEASYQTLSALLPAGQQAFLSTQHTNALNAIPNGAAKTTGISIGQTAASNLLTARTGDGNPGNSATPFNGSTGTGLWRPTPGIYGANGGGTFAPFDNQPGANAAWSSVKPFALPANWKSNAAFQAPAPPAVGSAAYNQAVANTQSLGAANSVTRTADQTQIAEFWFPGSTITWNDIARTIVASKGLSQDEEARDLALVNLSLADSRIAAWNAKFDSGYSLWRPITAIRDASNPNQDAAWVPLLPTPNHPSYISGHGTSGGAAAETLRELFGDSNSFTISSPSTWLPTPGISRSYTSLSQAEQESDDSRIYAGIHFSFDQSQGRAVGENVGSFVVTNELAATPEPGTLGLLGLGAGAALLRRGRKGQLA